ncbi:MAG: V-type ATP synthase subunit A [Candidatus Limnocylindrales bacterium]
MTESRPSLARPAAGTDDATAPGVVVEAGGPVIRAAGLSAPAMGEVVRVGTDRLLGEVIRLEVGIATIQVYEETSGLRIGDPVVQTSAPLHAWLGPGLLGATFDGLQRPLDALFRAGTWLLAPGLEARPLDQDRRWHFVPVRAAGEEVGPGDQLGTVLEGSLEHRILVPPGVSAGRLLAIEERDATVAESIGTLETAEGMLTLTLAHPWPVRVPRPAGRVPADAPLATGIRVIDMLFPVARGGVAVIPGGFGTGKTVVEQSLARLSDADIVVYVGCGERGNEMAELLASFRALLDPRTGTPLMDRTVLIANTSNMPVAARETSIQLGITIAEYFRDQGYHVALLADSTSRWAEALREISGRLEELPGEEGFPAYLASRLASFYERAGQVTTAGHPPRRGSITVVGAVSPPGGDFSEPVTQASLRLAGTFWALDTDLAHARHFPAISWLQSYSLYVDRLTTWYQAWVGPDWDVLRAEAIGLLARERQLLDIVELVGVDALPDEDRLTLEAARLMREAFLQQHAFDPVDASRPLDVQLAAMRAVLAARQGMIAALQRGATVEEATAAPALRELERIRSWTGSGIVQRLDALAERLRGAA